MTATVRLLCVLVVLAVCATAADPALLNLARPDVNFVMGINVSQIASSPRVTTALAEARRSKPEVEQLFQILGPNPLSNLEEIVIAGRLDPGQQNSEPENLLIAARGSFDGSAFTDLICLNGCEPQEYREREILSFQAQNTGETAYVAFLDSRYAALGKLEDVQGAIDRSAMETESVFNASLQTGIANLSHHHVWLAANGPFGDSLGGASGGGMMPPGAVSKLAAVGFGLSLGRDVELAIEVDSHSPQDAKQLHDMVNDLLALMKAGDADADAKALLNSMSLTQRGSSLSASLRIPEALIEKQLAQSRAQAQQPLASGAATADATITGISPSVSMRSSAPAPRPRRPGGIRIYGLKDGPVEFPTRPK